MRYLFFSTRAVVSISIGAALLLVGASRHGQAMPTGAGPQSRISQAINDQGFVPLKGNTPVFAQPKNDLGAASPKLPLKHMQLLLKRSAAQEAELKALLKEQQQPGSPNFRKWLTPEEFGARFGVSTDDLAKITGWLGSHGFEVESVAKSRLLITFSGTHEQLRAAFHVEMHQYSVNGETRLANSADPQIPVALLPVVSGFSSLTNYGPRPLHTDPRLVTRQKGQSWTMPESTQPKQRTGVGGVHPQFTVPISGHTYELVGPGDFATIYDVSPLWSQSIDGTGQSIAIVAQSDVNPADVDAFRAAFGLPEKKLNTIYVNDNPGLTGDGVESEAALDVEWSGAMAKGATIDLIVGESTNTEAGVQYAMEYGVDNNVAPILSVSWGACELALGVSGNEYFNAMWQQAAAQGISVLVASGDAGSAACDQNQYYAVSGEQVNGFASTPYNTAVGGTDFSANFHSGNTYWNATNDPVTLASAKGYIPETPWNESCASPEILAAAQVSGFTETTSEGLCNDSSGAFTDTAGGGGGASSCTVSDGQNPSSCQGGYPTPDWQANVVGTAPSTRSVPDLSFFSGSGTWGSAYLYCQSDATPDGMCNYSNGDAGYLAAGGTSFATPAFAGVLALLNQKSGTSLGNVNYLLYELGRQQYAGSASGIFNDITEGNIAVPCYAGSAGVPPSGLCTVSDPADSLGVLPDYNAGIGYDMATGLGSVDVSHLADAWAAASSGLGATQTRATLVGASTVTYGTPISVNVQVAPAVGADVPTGSVALLDENASTGSALGYAGLSAGAATISGNGLIHGTHTLLAHYGGNGTLAESTSSPVSITIQQAPTTIAVTPSRTTVTGGESVSLTVLVKTASTASSPSGSVTITDITTGKPLGTAAVAAATDASSGASIGTAFLTVAGSQLATGSNSLQASYSGDANYVASTGTQAVSYTGPFSLALAAPSLTLAPGATSGNTITITVAPNGSAVLSPSTLSFLCPGTLPTGLSCVFSAPTAGAGGSVSSTLTIVQSAPLVQSAAPSNRLAWFGASGVAGLACLFSFGIPARRRRLLTVVLAVACVSLFAAGCGSSQKAAVSSPVTSTTLTASSASPAWGSAVALTATVAKANNSGSPSGTVTFQNGANILGSSALSGGSAVFSTSSLPLGTQSITATYGGDSTFLPSTSSAAKVDVTLTANITVEVADNAGDSAVQGLTVTVK